MALLAVLLFVTVISVALVTSLLGSDAMTLESVLLLSMATVVAVTLQGRQSEPARER